MIPEENRAKLEKILMQEKTVSQREARELLGISSGQISTLIKKGKIKADENNKPYLKSVMEYTPRPNMKRHRKKTEKKA